MTRLMGAIQETVQRERDLQGVIVLTDGNDTAGDRGSLLATLLAGRKLPVFPVVFGEAAEAKIAHLTGRSTTAEEDAEWAGARTTFERFAAADRYLFNIPMWNNGIPYVLKQWIDIISQPGWTFGFDENGYVPLITGKKAAIV